ncbi:MMPL family transporter, partial [Clavibacter michiganensis]|uniref:MMPL family transporter n=1 Tax=Clavibacter michiganensis TaxID=28447 RepID=UPI0029308291
VRGFYDPAPTAAPDTASPTCPAGKTALLTVNADTGPLETDTTSLVRDIRALGDDSTSVQVTASTAIARDSDEQLRSALIAYVALVVGLSFLLIVLLFRSFLVPLIASGGFLLSLASALGSTVEVFLWGVVDAVGP